MKNHEMSRRQLLDWIGKTAGAGAIYQAMILLGFAAGSSPPITKSLVVAPRSASGLIPGAGFMRGYTQFFGTEPLHSWLLLCDKASGHLLPSPKARLINK